jgi:hypothetical protein
LIKPVPPKDNHDREILDLYNQIETLNTLLVRTIHIVELHHNETAKELDRTNHELAKHIASHISHFPRENNAQEVFDT